MRIIYSHQASEDLISVWEYLHMQNPQAAKQLAAEIDNGCARIREFPLSGQAHDEIRLGLRQLVIGNYLLFYKVSEKEIEIVRIIHSARYLPELI